MKKIILVALMTMMVSSISQAHDEGHGPKVTDSGKYGGILASVVLKAEASKGTQAAMLHKAELVRSTDGTVRLYIYDVAMKPMDLKGFDGKAKATLFGGSKGKKQNSEFLMEQKEGVFQGKMPKVLAAPYSIDVTLKASGKDLLVAFDNLD